MKMTLTFANQLMDSLAILALCAYHGDNSKHNEIEEYTRNTYLRLCEEWEEKTGEKWEVVK